MCLGVFVVGWSWSALAVAGVLYAIRMFAITGFYHRYFSHRAFKTSRVASSPSRFWERVQCNAAHCGGLPTIASTTGTPIRSSTSTRRTIMAFGGPTWAGSRRRRTFPRTSARYPELKFLDRFDILVPVALAVTLYALGGWQWLIWGFFVSTVALFHATCLINSLAHVWGHRRYETGEESRNNLALALVIPPLHHRGRPPRRQRRLGARRSHRRRLGRQRPSSSLASRSVLLQPRLQRASHVGPMDRNRSGQRRTAAPLHRCWLPQDLVVHQVPEGLKGSAPTPCPLNEGGASSAGFVESKSSTPLTGALLVNGSA